MDDEEARPPSLLIGPRLAGGEEGTGAAAGAVGDGPDVVPPRRGLAVAGQHLKEAPENGEQRLDAGAVLAEAHEGGHEAPRVGLQLARREPVVTQHGDVEVVQREPHAGIQRVLVDDDAGGRRARWILPCAAQLVHLGNAVLPAQRLQIAFFS